MNGYTLSACLATILPFWAATRCAAAEEGQVRTGVLRRITVASGFSSANLKDQEQYEVLPTLVRFSLDPRGAARKVGLELSENWDFNCEPYFGQVISPGNDQELGCLFFVRWSRPLFTPSVRLYLEVGSGPMHMTTATEEQSTFFNFLDQVGVGLSCRLGSDWALEVGYRGWHISNAGIEHPNRGFEGNTVLCGLSHSL